MTAHPELGFYTLGGHVESPRAMLGELRLAEELGLGAAFLSERFALKEAASLTGAAGAVTEDIRIITGATNHGTRHPAVTAAWATTVHRLTGGRLTLGLGRGLAPQLAAFGLPPVTTAQLEAFIGLMRRLWRGETVTDWPGCPALRLDPTFDERIPVGLTAFGPKTLALAGRAADVVMLHTYFSDETTARCVETVRTAAERAGRDPAAVEVWSCFATVPDTLDEETQARRTVARLATYLQVYGDLMVRTNGWIPLHCNGSARTRCSRDSPAGPTSWPPGTRSRTSARSSRRSGWRLRRRGRPRTAPARSGRSSTWASTA
ncbi:hypothetical protein GCM10009836_50490 [Pseudonocardia ailaonensis]|uniref:Luciferase-like domain-containing protein n=1 Tax=Pseudonocardia ailaonensis TaxID=367279 RepID=A0ABN2ND87_9PSEU